MKTHDSASRSSRKKKLHSPISHLAETSKRDDQHPATASTPVILRDDLVDIDGIDPTIEMALNSLGIRRFTNFDGYTPKSLSQALHDRAGISVSAETIATQDWLGGAQILVEENAARFVPPAKKDAAKDAPRGAFSPERMSAEIKSNGAGDQKAVGATNDSSAEGVLPENKPIQKQSAHAEKDIVLHIKHVRFTQQTEPADNPLAKRLRGEIACELARPKQAVTMDQMTLCAQVHAVNLASGVSELLAAKSHFVLPHRDDYATVIDFEAPQLGRYQLQIVALLLGAQPVIACRPGPVLRVVP